MSFAEINRVELLCNLEDLVNATEAHYNDALWWQLEPDEHFGRPNYVDEEGYLDTKLRSDTFHHIAQNPNYFQAKMREGVLELYACISEGLNNGFYYEED